MQLPDLATGVTWSICVRDAATSRVLVEREPDVVLDTASIGKVFLLVEVAARAEAGTLDLGEELTRADDDAVADSGLWHLMRRGSLAVGDLCWLVGGVSDNLATNVLLRRVGLDAVQERSRALGLERSALLDRVRDDRGADHPPALSSGCAGELSELMARLHRGNVVGPDVSARVLRWLAANSDLSMTASALGLDPLAHAGADRGITLVNKTGTDPTVRADVGLVMGARASVAYAVLASWDDGDPRDSVLADMRELGLAIREAVT